MILLQHLKINDKKITEKAVKVKNIYW